jgi:two-component sensor histidine kinase
LPPTFDIENSKGLGLKVIRALAHQMGGTVIVKNGRPGTTFTIEFPGE